MMISRAQVVQFCTAGLSLFSSNNNNNNIPPPPSPSSCVPTPETASFHPPPKDAIQNDNSNVKDYYNLNPTIFGRILDGTTPSSPISESDTLLTFHDRTRRAPLHALIIPKQYIKSVYDLNPQDLELVTTMQRTALETIQSCHPEAYDTHDYILCFHVPPFTSVDHLHLHVLAPASDMQWEYRYGKYLRGMKWCTGVEMVAEALVSGERFR